MSYLIWPQSPLHPPIEVPCEATEDYDGLALESYPQRKGYGENTHAEWIRMFTSPTQKFKSFLQTWLFFGLINQAMLPSPRQSAMSLKGLSTTLENPSRTIIDTVKLKALVEEWIGLRNTSSAPIPRCMATNAIINVMLIINCFERHDQDSFSVEGNEHRLSLVEFLSNIPVKNPLSAEVTLSVNLLLDILYTGLQIDRTNSPSTHRHVDTFKTNRLGRWASPITPRMRDDGWCPYNISMIHERFNSAGLCFVSDLDRPSPDLRHSSIRVLKASQPAATSSSDAGKDLCTHYRCAETMLKPEEYRTRHAEGCTGCKDMVADRDEIHRILLEKGTFPLVLTIDEDDGDDDEHITLCEYEEDISYVAISHVWSDGLGNLERNALPRCQMLRLSKYVRDLQGKETEGILLLWIDTLCVPPDPIQQDEEVLDAQEVAITFMRKSYQAARAVLVLDCWLLTYTIAPSPPIEILMRVASSTWNTRLWTLQEGALARNLIFQFADAAFDSEDGIVDMLRDSNSASVVTLHTAVVKCFEDIRSLAWDDMKKPNLIALMHALKVRSTSVSSDEALCLGALMKLDLATIVKAPAAHRMKTFWSLLEHVPKSLVFYTGTKLQDPGYRWAPSSFLRPTSRSQDIRPNLPGRHQTTEEPGKVTHHGLEISSPGLDIFLSCETPIQAELFFYNAEGVYFSGQLPKIKVPQEIAGIFHSDHARFVTPMKDTDYVVMDTPALLTASGVSTKFMHGRYVRVMHIVLQNKHSLSYAAASGLLAYPSTRQTEDGVIAVRGVCRINITRIGSAEDCLRTICMHLNRPLAEFRRVEEGFEPTDGSGFFPIASCVQSDSRVWCVD